MIMITTRMTMAIVDDRQIVITQVYFGIMSNKPKH